MKNRYDPSNLTLIDLFSGAGGTSLGFKLAGFKIAGAVEINPTYAKTYKRNIGVKPIVDDIRNVSGEEILGFYSLDKDEVFLLTACPPCQGFSIMRSGKGRTDPRNELIFILLKRISEIRPKVIVFENVPGMLSGWAYENYFKPLVDGLKKLGYAVKWKILNAADYGVPQIRKRLVLIGTVLKDLKRRISFPKGKFLPREKWLRLRKKRYEFFPWVTVREALDGLPPIRPCERDPRIPNHIAPCHSERIIKILEKIKPGGSIRDLPKRYWLKCHKHHKGHKDVYGRLRWDEPSVTITTGCTQPSKGRFIHPSQPRGLTPREAARLQTFPDLFVFLGNITEVARQIGEAFPPKLAYVIARHILTIIGYEEEQEQRTRIISRFAKPTSPPFQDSSILKISV